ncbi:MAG: MarR family transcriptional regulator [Ktedonobacteraceae bacterium]|nr:MarR family transcriptional regulator [Ktedonobacteraceae bacterium]
MYTIYALIDVRDNSIRYVGLATNIFTRLSQHLLDTGKNTPEGLWLAEMQQAGLSPRLEALETLDSSKNTYQQAYERKKYWIQKLTRDGASLINVNDSGSKVKSSSRQSQHVILSPTQLRKYRKWLKWSREELSRRANIHLDTIYAAENGEPVLTQVANTLAEALSSGSDKRITPADIVDTRLEQTQLRAWRTFITAYATVIDLIEHELAEAGQLPLSSYDVLLALVEAPNRRLRMHELAQAVVLSRSGLTRLVDRLEREGLLRRERNGSDRRATYAVLTLKGFRAFRQAWPVYVEGIIKYFVQYLGEEELDALTQMLERVLRAAHSESPPRR